MTSWPVLSLTIFLPILGLAAILFTKDPGGRNALRIGLVSTALTFLLSLMMLASFDRGLEGFQFVEKANWLPGLSIAYHVGLDGISLWLVLLTSLLSMTAVVIARYSVQERVKGIVMAILLLEALVIGAFSALDLILFYIFFEGTLIPAFVLIGVWGLDRRIYAAFKFFLFTLAGSLLFLLAILTIYLKAGTTDIPTLMTTSFAPSLQTWLWLGMFASFAVKMPLWPLHTWAPDAYAEGPLAGTIMLSGVLSKLGAYGFLRFALPMLPDASQYFSPLIFALSTVGIIYTSLVALMQRDMKRLVAYSSVAHMGFVTIGCFAINSIGLQGALVQMLSHGLVTAAMFICVGVAYARTGSYSISSFSGFAGPMPVYAAFFVFFALASIGVPGTSAFVGEVLVIVGVFKISSLVALLAATSMVLGAGYMLWLCRRVIFNAPTPGVFERARDLGRSEMAIMASFAALVLLFGVYPSLVTSPMTTTINASIAHVEAAIGRQVGTHVAAVPITDQGAAAVE